MREDDFVTMVCSGREWLGLTLLGVYLLEPCSGNQHGVERSRKLFEEWRLECTGVCLCAGKQAGRYLGMLLLENWIRRLLTTQIKTYIDW